MEQHEYRHIGGTSKGDWQAAPSMACTRHVYRHSAILGLLTPEGANTCAAAAPGAGACAAAAAGAGSFGSAAGSGAFSAAALRTAAARVRWSSDSAGRLYGRTMSPPKPGTCRCLRRHQDSLEHKCDCMPDAAMCILEASLDTAPPCCCQSPALTRAWPWKMPAHVQARPNQSISNGA